MHGIFTFGGPQSIRDVLLSYDLVKCKELLSRASTDVSFIGYFLLFRLLATFCCMNCHEVQDRQVHWSRKVLYP